MTTALVGLFGVVLGLIGGFGYRFWANRRDELAEALVATTRLHEELRALLADPQRSSILLDGIWAEEGRALVIQMEPRDYRTVAEAIATASAERDSAAVAVRIAEGLRSLFWDEHQAFILTPYFRYVSRDTLSKRIESIVNRR